MRQRYYDLDIGRFNRRDSYEGRQLEPLTLHKYLYTHANPINFTDPTGLLLLAEVNTPAIQSNLASTRVPVSTKYIASTHVRLLIAGLILAGGAAAYYAASSALLEEEQEELKERIEAQTAANPGSIPIFHYTGRGGMMEIVASQTILATAAYRGGGFTHPTGAYATDIPPIGPFTQTQLRNLYRGGNQSWDVSHFVMMLTHENSFTPSGYPSEWISYAPYPKFPVPVITRLSGANLMPP